MLYKKSERREFFGRMGGVDDYFKGLIFDQSVLFAFNWAVNYLQPIMGQVLRITFNQQDYTFEILNTRPVSKETEEIQILLNGVTYTLVCEQRRWVPKTESGELPNELAAAIGKTIALRYRI